MIDRTFAPPYKIPEKINYTSPVKQIMPNGVDLHVICAGMQQVMRFVMVFEAGMRYQAQPFVAAATLNMLSEGTLNYTSAEIAEKFDFYGSSFEVSVDRDWAIVSVYCLTKYCNETLQLIDEIIKYPIFPKKELDVYIQKHKEILRIEEEKVDFVARREFLKLLYVEKHPYGLSGSVADYDLLHRDLLSHYYQSHITSSKLFMILAGNIGDNEIATVQRYFGNEKWGIPALANNFYITPEERGSKKIFIPKSNVTQSAIRVGRILFPKNHSDNIGMQVLTTILGGYFGSRLMRNIREDKGYVYDIYSMIVSQKDSGYLSIVTETGNDYTKNVLKELNNEILVLQNELISNDELNLVKQYIFGDVLRTLDGAWGQAEVCLDNVLSGLPSNYVELFFNEVRDITPQRVQQLAKQYLNTSELHEVVVGKQ